MFLGAQHHRPPNPPREDWDRDMRLMAESGLSVVRTWLYWLAVNPEPDVWDFEEYDAYFEAARRNGMKVLVQLMLDSPPAWFAERHPDTLYVDAQGFRVELASHQAQQVGGAPGPCFHVEAAKAGAEEYLRRTVERYREHEALLAWDVWNEVWIVDCHCPATQAEFRRWLIARYETVAGLNRAWRTHYRDVGQARIPKRGVYAPLLDAARFRRWVRADLMRHRAELVKSLDPEHPTVSHGGMFGATVDPWTLTGSLDVWGVSCYRHDLHNILLDLDTTRSAAKGKPWWLSEEPGGFVWHDRTGHGARTPGQIRSTTLAAIGRGAEAALFWQWRPELFGQESPHYGVTTVAGGPTPRSVAIGELGAMLRRRRQLFDRLIPAAPDVGLVVDLDALAYEKAGVMQDVWYGGGGASSPWSDHFRGLYRALIDRGYVVQILSAGELVDSGVPASLKVLVLPMQVVERTGLIAGLARWVEDGGALVAGPLCGLYGPDTFTNRSQPPEDVAELFGVTQDGDLSYVAAPEIELVPNGVLPGLGGDMISGAHVLQPLTPRGETAILGVTGELVTLTAARRGQGFAVMLGSLVGSHYGRGERAEAGVLLGAVCRGAGAVPEATATGGVLIRLAACGASGLLFLHNPRDVAVEAWVRLLGPIEGEVTDLLTEASAARARSGQPFLVHVGPRDSRVLLVGEAGR